MQPAIVVHGGAGRGAPDESEARAVALRRAVDRGWAVLGAGGPALDAVVEAVCELENHPSFNAGLGSVLTSVGSVEMDASVMEGRGLAAGAVGAVQGVRNPIRLARAVLDDGHHVFLVGEQARARAGEWKIEVCAPDELITAGRRAQWESHSDADAGNTVGAVALDAAGHVAAATSTGGLAGKWPGRVGDSALVGAGTYADDCLGAVSATGSGETIMRLTVARRVADLLGTGTAPQAAVERVLREGSARVAGDVGVISVDPLGRIGYASTTAQMPVAWRRGASRETYVER